MRLLIDTDPGIDDALALLYAFHSPEATIEAITTVAGNVSLEKTTRNAHRIVHHAGLPSPPPIFPGAAQPLSHPPAFAEHVHGDDGLAGLGHPIELPEAPLLAAQVIVDAAHRFPHQLTLIALGPLTNLALAHRFDPTALALYQRIFVMGGAWQHAGNITPFAEFNFYADPQAVQEVLAAGAKLTILPLNVTHQARLTKQWLESALGHREDPRAHFVRHLTAQYFRFYQSKTGEEACFLHDPLCVAAAIDPALVRCATVEMTIDASDGPTRGQLLPGPYAVELVTECDLPKFFEGFSSRVCLV